MNYNSNVEPDAEKVLIPSAILIGAVKIYDILFRYSEKTIHSMTPNEMERYLLDKYETHMGDLMIILTILNNRFDLYGEDKAREIFEKHAKQYVEEMCLSAENIEECRKREYDRLVDMFNKVIDMVKNEPNSIKTLETVRGFYDILLDIFDKTSKPVPSILFIGQPGIGKSETVYRVAKRLAERYGLEFIEYKGSEQQYSMIMKYPWRFFVLIDFRLTSVEPSDLQGIPMSNETVSYKPFQWAYILNKVPGILFLDELTNVSRNDVLSASYQLILDRKAGFTKFNVSVMVLSAGNPPEYATGIARKLPQPLADRFIIIETIPPTPEQWIEYMNRTYGDNWLKKIGSVVSTLAIASETEEEKIRIFAPPPTARRGILHPHEKLPTPRGWTRVSLELYKYYKSRGKDPEQYFTELAIYITTNGLCENIRSMIIDPKDFDKLVYDAKVTCEELVGTIGTIYADGIIRLSAIRLPASLEEEAKMSAEELDRYYTELAEEIYSSMHEIISKIKEAVSR